MSRLRIGLLYTGFVFCFGADGYVIPCNGIAAVMVSPYADAGSYGRATGELFTFF